MSVDCGGMLEYPKSPSPQERSIIYTPGIIILWGNLWLLTEELCDFALLCPSGKGRLTAVVLSFCCGPNATHPRTQSNVFVLECHHIHKCTESRFLLVKVWRFRWNPWNLPFFPPHHLKNQWVNRSGIYTHSHSLCKKKGSQGSHDGLTNKSVTA